MTEKDAATMDEQAVEANTPETQAEENAPKKPPKKAKGPQDAAELAALEEALAAAEADKADLQDKLLRTAAEYDNYRRRSQKEKDGAFNDGIAHAVLELLPVLDTLEAAANAQSGDEEYKKGVLLTLSKAEEVFKKLGVEEIDAMGATFDPLLHNACMQDAGDGAESGDITRVIQKGYTLGERVIRHAMVAVCP